jgi:homogentisate 1,2-dioxygenase
MAPPVTDFAIKDSYNYLYGFGSYHQSEAFPGANPLVNNSPQNPPYGLRTERISGSSFTAPREQNLQTWLYRSTSSLTHSEFVACEELDPAKHLTPNAYSWPTFDLPTGRDWTHQKLLGRNGDPAAKNGLAIWVFSIEKDMPERTAYSSLDGDCLIIPQAGALDIQTELGKLLVRQNEIAVIPRGVRYRVTLPAGPTRGYLCEVFQGHFQLPALGIVGSTGLANVRDFQIPTAFYDGSLSEDQKVANANNAEWTIKSRLNSRLWKCDQDHTPFDVAAWHGTFYPFKYDLARFCHLGNAVFDEHDPSLFVVLTVPSHREPGTAVLDFAVISERWQTGEDTLWIPYYHRNTMSEFYGPIINNQNPKYPFTEGAAFKPFAAGLNGSMVTHGANEDEYERASNQDTSVPKKQLVDGISIFLLETEMPLFLTDWAYEGAVKNFREKPKGAAKM